MSPALWKASFRHLLRRRSQLALALAGLALGVGTITAVDIATASARRAFELSMDAVNGAATHQIVAPNGVDERLYSRLRREQPTLDSAPIVEGYVDVGERSFQLLGVDPFAGSSMRGATGSAALGTAADERRSLDIVRDWLMQPGAVMMSPSAAHELALESGARFTLEVAGHRFGATLIALTGGEEAGGDSLLLTDIAQAQEWLGLRGALSRIDVRIPEGAAGSSRLEALRALLPPDAQVLEAQRRARQSLDMTAAFTINLRAMSLLALLVSVFLIYSAMSFTVLQRRRTLAILRVVGATRAEVLRLVLVEALALGAAGAAAGLALGIAIGRALVSLVSRTINDLYFVVAVRETPLPASAIVLAVAAGIGAALVAAAVPAVEAAWEAPNPGLRRSALETKARRLSRWLVPVGAALSIAAGLVVVLSQRSLIAGFAALLLVLLAVAAVTPAALRAVAVLARRLAARTDPTVRLAVGEIAESLSRTGVAIAALGVAVSAMLGVSIMVESFRGSLREWLERTLSADIYVSAPGPGFGRPERRLDPGIVAQIVAMPQIARHSATRRVTVESERGPVQIEAAEFAPGAQRGIDVLTEGADAVWRAFDSGSVLVSQPLSWRLQLAPGDAIRLATRSGPHDFRIAGIYRDYASNRGTVLMAREIYRSYWRDGDVTALGLYLDPGIRAEALIEALRALAAPRQSLMIRSNVFLRELSLSIFERTFVITRVLYWLAAGVAAVGLVSALLAWRLERARELAVLRSVGVTPLGALALIEIQTAFMGLASLAVAAPAGVLTAVLLIEVINRRAFGWQIDLHLHGAQFANAALVAVSAALVAGLYPAWRGARAPVAAALREE